METIIGKLMPDVECNERTNGDADGKAGDIDKGDGAIFQQIAIGGGDVVFEHKSESGFLDKQDKK